MLKHVVLAVNGKAEDRFSARKIKRRQADSPQSLIYCGAEMNFPTGQIIDNLPLGVVRCLYRIKDAEGKAYGLANSIWPITSGQHASGDQKTIKRSFAFRYGNLVADPGEFRQVATGFRKRGVGDSQRVFINHQFAAYVGKRCAMVLLIYSHIMYQGIQTGNPYFIGMGNHLLNRGIVVQLILYPL